MSNEEANLLAAHKTHELEYDAWVDALPAGVDVDKSFTAFMAERRKKREDAQRRSALFGGSLRRSSMRLSTSTCTPMLRSRPASSP